MQKTDRKTVLQQLIDSIKMTQALNPHDESVQSICEGIIENATTLLPAERQQMEDAFNKGSALNNYSTSMDLDWKYKDFTDYFTQTFNNGE